MTGFEEKVYNAVRRIPRGRVATYRAVARAAGRPAAYRAVGNALNKNPYRNVPCHRVICLDGKIGGFARGREVKQKILSGEGVRISRGRVGGRFIISGRIPCGSAAGMNAKPGVPLKAGRRR